jgi:hypothetical protein
MSKEDKMLTLLVIGYLLISLAIALLADSIALRWLLFVVLSGVGVTLLATIGGSQHWDGDAVTGAVLVCSVGIPILGGLVAYWDE